MKLVFLSAVLLLAVSCTSKKPGINGCYNSDNGKDRVLLNIESKDGKVSGELDYMIAEKDRNAGSFEGTFDGELLLLNYTFDSEGTTSVRQVAFKKSGDKLSEGYGDMQDESGRMIFTDVSKLKFGNGIILEKTSCD